MELEISQAVREDPAFCFLHPAFNSKKSSRVIVSSLPEPKVWECCWEGILFQPDFALNGAAQTAHLQEAGELEEHGVGLLWEFPPLPIFLILYPSLQYCPLLAPSTWKLRQGLVGSENQKSM